MGVETVESKTSGTPGSGPVLGEEQLKEFAGAIEKDNVVDSGAAPATEETPAPAPSTEETPAPAPSTETPPADWKPPTYDDYKKTLDRQAQYERDLATAREKVLEEANKLSREQLIAVAEAHPELRDVIYGKDPSRSPAPPAPAPAPAAPTPGAKPPDPVMSRLEAIEKTNAQMAAQLQKEQQLREQRERVETLDRIQEKAEAQMEKHSILKKGSPMFETGCELIAHILSREPKTPIEAVVDRVGKHLHERIEQIKASYIKDKKTVSTQVRPGAGGGPAAPPGGAPGGPKLKLSDGSVGKAFGRALEAAQRQAAGQG